MIKQVLTFSDGIHALHATPDLLWIAHQGGVTGFDPRSGELHKWTTLDGLPALPALHVASEGDRIAVATPNGVAWHDDVKGFLSDAAQELPRLRWQQGLMHPMGAGAYVNGVAFVQGKLYAATGGGRLYREGADGFELLELPLRQARLVRLQQLASPKRTLRLLIVTNNSGVLLLATGAHEEPSLYQWSEDEGLCSRYVTGMTLVKDHVVVAVHGCVHVVPLSVLVAKPEELSRWGRIHLREVSGSPEHNRIPALCEHGEHLFVGTTSGLYRVPIARLATAAYDDLEAERVDEAPVRHLASGQGELWVVQMGGLGHYAETGRQSPGRLETAEGEGRFGGLRTRLLGRRGSTRTSEPMEPPLSAGGWRRLRFIPESRWREASREPELRQVLCLAASPEGLAAGGEAGRIVLYEDGRWTTEVVARLRRPPEVHTLAYDPENTTFWAATRYGLYQRDPRGRWHRDLAFPGRTVHALSVWGGNVVALGSAGLHMFVQSEWTEIVFPNEAPPLFVAASSESGLALAGRPGSTLHVWSAGSSGPEPTPLTVGRANCMTWGDSGELWIGADRGLLRWDGSSSTNLVWNDEKRDHITSLMVYRGRLYVGSQAGVWVASLEALRAASGEDLESQGERWGLLQGLPEAHVTSMVVHDSGVWVATAGGIALLE